MSMAVSFNLHCVSVVINATRQTASECLAEVDAARAVLLRHVDPPVPATVPVLPTFDEWVAGREKPATDARMRQIISDRERRDSPCCLGLVVPDNVYAELPADSCGDLPSESGLMSYETEEQRDDALRGALLKLGEIRGDA